MEDVARDLSKAQAHGVAVEGFEGENLQEEKVESALHQVGRSAHFFPTGVSSVTETKIHLLRSVSKGKIWGGKNRKLRPNVFNRMVRSAASENLLGITTSGADVS